MGNVLFETVVLETDLTNEPIREELARLLARYDKSPETMTVKDLRTIMLAYLDEVFLSTDLSDNDAEIHAG